MELTALESLSDPRRLAIIELLADGERCVCDISGALGISDALASHHLKRLREAGLVHAERRGVWLHCRLEPGAFERLAEEVSSLAGRARAAARDEVCCGSGDPGDISR